MMIQVLCLTRWELFKLRKRWMPWILLGIVVAITQLILWGNYAAYHNESIQSFLGSASFYSSSTQTEDGIVSIELTCNDVREGRVAEKLEALPEDFRQRRLDDVQEFSESCSGVAVREAFREIFVLPSSIVNGISVTHMIGVFLVMILAASVPGAEYGWGTLRNALSRGVGRWQFLASKLLLLLLVSVGALLIVSALNAVSSLIAAAIPPGEAGGLFDSGEWSDASVFFGKAVYGLAPYIVLGMFLAVLIQSSASGISFSLGYYVVEMIVSPFLQLTSWLENVPNYLIGHNVNFWITQAGVVSVEVTRAGVPVAQPGMLHAFLVILVYVVVLGAATFWLFQREANCSLVILRPGRRAEQNPSMNRRHYAMIFPCLLGFQLP